MFISPVNSYNNNCRKPCKTSFKANPETVVKTIEKQAEKLADEVPVKKAKSWFDEFFEGVAKQEEEKSYDSTWTPFGPFDPNMINYG